jgi:hypothetical protein
MCGDFNIRHASWDPNRPEVCVHADRLMAVCDALGLTLSSPVAEGPTHFPYNEDLTPTIIDLMFVPAEVSLTTEHEIHPDLRGTSDHAPLTVTLPGPDSEVPVTRWSIQLGSDKEQAYLGEVLESLELLLGWEGQTAGGGWTRSLRRSPLPSLRPGTPRPRKLEGANTLMGGGPKNAVTPLPCIVPPAMPTIGRTTDA